jgi:hypothetical protein
MAQFHAQIGNIEEALGNKLLPVITSTISYITAHWPDIQSALTTVWGVISPIFTALIAIIKGVVDAIRQHWSQIQVIIQPAVDAIKTAVKIITDALKLVTDLLQGKWGAAWHEAQKLVTDVLNGIVQQVTDRVKIVEMLATKIGQALLSGIKAGASTLLGWLTSLWTAVVSGITGLVGTVTGAAQQFGKAILNGIITGLKDMGKALEHAIIDPLTAILARVESMVGSIPIVGGALKSALGAIGLAEGGVVKAKPGGTLALIGEGGEDEIVAPKSWFSSVSPLGGASGFGGSAIHIHVDLDGQQITEVVYQGFKAKGRLSPLALPA